MTRIGQGAYADLTGLDGDAEHLVRARSLLDRVGQVVVSHQSAALAWGLPTPSGPLGQVQLSPLVGRQGNPKSGPGYRLHSARVPPESTSLASGLLVPDPGLTVLQCARTLPLDWCVAIADAALHRGMVEAESVAAAAARTRGVPGAARVRALPTHMSALAESPGESLLRLRLKRMRLDVAEQVVLSDVPGSPRVDFIVEGVLVVEFDGRSKYGMAGDPASAHWAEKVRHDWIVERGHPVLRVIWRDLWDERALSHRVHRTLRRSGRS
jgi:very-short-patch-repair endonuclease